MAPRWVRQASDAIELELPHQGQICLAHLPEQIWVANDVAQIDVDRGDQPAFKRELAKLDRAALQQPVDDLIFCIVIHVVFLGFLACFGEATRVGCLFSA